MVNTCPTMKNVLSFISIARDCFTSQLEGIYAYSRGKNWHVQVVENSPGRRGIKVALSQWRPAGVIAEYSEKQKISKVRELTRADLIRAAAGVKMGPGHGSKQQTAQQ